MRRERKVEKDERGKLSEREGEREGKRNEESAKLQIDEWRMNGSRMSCHNQTQ